jgi:hypothetical protein
MRRRNGGDILQESNYLEGVFRNIIKKSFQFFSYSTEWEKGAFALSISII